MTMAKHLALCERKSAYPSEEKAKAAIVTHSMLDVLGLMRRPEEPSAEKEETEEKSKMGAVNEDTNNVNPVDKDKEKVVEEEKEVMCVDESSENNQQEGVCKKNTENEAIVVDNAVPSAVTNKPVTDAENNSDNQVLEC